MDFSKELIEKAKTASSAEELLTMAKEMGVELSEADAEAYFSFLNGSRPLSDDELEQVAGGKGEPKPKYHAGQRVVFYDPRCTDPRYGAIMSDAWFSSVVKAFFYYVQLDDGEVMDFALEEQYCPCKVL